MGGNFVQVDRIPFPAKLAAFTLGTLEKRSDGYISGYMAPIIKKNRLALKFRNNMGSLSTVF